MGSFYKNKHTGNFGNAGIFSFNGNKTITTGGGGAIISNSDEFYLKAKHLTTTAKVKHKWEYIHDKIGYNYRMPNINAAIGCAQIETINSIINRKRNLFAKYKKLFEGINNIKLFEEPENAERIIGCKH